MNRINVKELFIQLRNGLAFSFSWLVLCSMILAAVYGKESLSVSMLFKLFLLCFWAVLCFIVCFKDALIRKKGFIFRLSLFYVLFVPVEVLMFFFMNVFAGAGTAWEWIAFAAVIVGLYVICVLIDWMVCRKQGDIYTRRLLAYNERRANEQHNIGDDSSN